MQINIKLLQLSISFVIFLILIGCKPKKSELYGKYIADNDIATEKLTLNNDGTFIQEVKLKTSSKVDIGKGTWEYNSNIDNYITFKGFMIVFDVYGKLRADYSKPQPGLVIYPADDFFVNIWIGSSEGRLYKKIE